MMRNCCNDQGLSAMFLSIKITNYFQIVGEREKKKPGIARKL